jgi:Flp pilus assembly protein TadG
MSRRRIRGDLGSLTVELVVITPILLVMALMMLAFGRVSASRQEVVEASRAGAQAAAVMSNANSAQWGAAVDAAVGISNRGHTCTNPQIVTDTSHFHPGGYVTVTVTCHVELSDVAVPGMPGSTAVQASATAPIDPYRAVG